VGRFAFVRSSRSKQAEIRELVLELARFVAAQRRHPALPASGSVHDGPTSGGR
jgi:hypothetical protein